MTEPNITESVVAQPTDNSQPVVEQVESSKQPETPVEEVKPVETKEEDDPKFAARFAALSRKERELLQKEQSIKQSQREYQAYQKAVQDAKNNPVAYLQAAGLTLEEAIQKIINEGKEPTPEEVLKKDVDSIKAEVEAYKKAAQEHQARQMEQRKQAEEASILNNLKTYVESNPEKYELIMAYNAIPDVWEVIKRTYLETGGKVHLTEEQAAEAVENDLLEQAREEAKRVANLKKLQTESNQVKVSNPKEVSKVSQTLTNQTATTPASPPKRLSREDSIKEAAKLLKWKE